MTRSNVKRRRVYVAFQFEGVHSIMSGRHERVSTRYGNMSRRHLVTSLSQEAGSVNFWCVGQVLGLFCFV